MKSRLSCMKHQETSSSIPGINRHENSGPIEQGFGMADDSPH